MITRVKLLTLLLLLLFTISLPAQNKPIAQSLLWRITGNGLKKPSYLYGTVHLRHKQLFNFGDSIYRSLEDVDAFAMELDPEAISGVVADQITKSQATVYLRDQLGKAEFERFNKKLKKEYGVDADAFTLKDFYNLKERLVLPQGAADDMSTFMDAYLYSIAKGQGKTVVGLEDVSDQVEYIEEKDYQLTARDIKSIFQEVKLGKAYVKQMFTWYLNQDIVLLQQASQNSGSNNRDTIFNKRNHKMAFRFDSLIKNNVTYFVAVGAAHLAGEEGVIMLMQKKGYTVEPVYSSKNIAPEAYSYIKAELKWKEFQEPSLGYSIKMPGKPSSSEMLNGEMKVRMYYDLANGMVYYASFMRPETSVTAENKDSVFNKMVTSTIQNGAELYSQQPIERYGMPGLEMFYRNKAEDMFIRMQILAKGRKLYMLMIGSQKRQSLDSSTTEFFSSFKVMADQPVRWAKIPSEMDAFEMSWPQQPEVSMLNKEMIDSSFTARRYMSALDNQGLYFFLLVSRTIANYVIPDDSLYFRGVLQNMQMQNYEITSAPEMFTWEGYPAMRLQARSKTGLLLKAKSIIRGNRVYTAMVMHEKDKENEPEVDHFINSLRFLPFPSASFSRVISPQKDFTAELPLQEIAEGSDSTNTRVKTYYAYDSLRSTTYSITSSRLSPYLWARTDTAFLKKQMHLFIGAKDSLTSHSFSKNGNSHAVDFSIKTRNSNLLHRVRVILHGRSVYYLESKVTEDKDADAPVTHFFKSFLPLTDPGNDLLVNGSATKLFQDLTSADSATYDAAYTALDDMEFSKDDLTVLFREALSEHRLDSERYKSVNTILFDKIFELRDPAVLPLVKENYARLQKSQDQYKYSMLRALGNVKTKESYKLIEELISSGLPADGNAASFLYPLHDSLALTKEVFPALLNHIGDSLLSMPLAYLQQTMIDSNMMKPAEIASYKRAWIAVGRKRITEIKKEDLDFSARYDTDLIQLLLSYRDHEANQVVTGFLPYSPVYIKKLAVLGLLKNGVAVHPKHAEQIAADKHSRVDFYEELMKTGNAKLYPAKYLNQKSFAEAYLYGTFDEDEPAEIIPQGERVVTFKGRKQKFYLYKLVYKYDDEEFNYLGVSGPFELKSSGFLSEDCIAGMIVEDVDKLNVSDRLKSYLAEYEGSESRE